MTTAETLREARALIDTPRKWTRAADARTADGKHTWPSDPNAVCFCMAGALIRLGEISTPAYRALLRHVTGGTLMEFNDAPGTSHADVLAAFDAAIAEVSS